MIGTKDNESPELPADDQTVDVARSAKERGAIRAFAALGLFFAAGYGAGLLTKFAAPELVTNLGSRAVEYGRPHNFNPAIDEFATVKRDLNAALEQVSMAKDKEAEWMRIFTEDDTKAVALSRELEAARKEIANYSTTLSSMRSERLEARDVAITAEAKVHELTQAISVDRDKVVPLSRDLRSVREELFAGGASVAAARNDLVQERRTAEATENEVSQLDIVFPSPDQRKSRQIPTSLPA